MKLIDGVSFKSFYSPRKALEDFLQQALKRTLPFDSHPEMAEEWDKSVAPAIWAYARCQAPECNSYEDFEQESFFNQQIRDLLKKFRVKYSEFISDSAREKIELTENSCFLNEKLYETLATLFLEFSQLSVDIEKTLVILNWFSSVNKEICPIINQSKINFLGEPIIDFLQEMCDESVFNELCGTRVDGEIEQEKLDTALNKLEIILPSILNVIDSHKKGSKAIEYCLDDGSLIYLSSDSKYSVVSTPSVCGGSLRIEGTRIPIQEIWLDSKSGLSPVEIVDSWEGLNLYQVYAALKYCSENEESVANQLKKYSDSYEKSESDWLAGIN